MMEDQNTLPVKPENQATPPPTTPPQPTIQSTSTTPPPVSANSLQAEQKKPKLIYFLVIGLVVIAALGTVLYFTVFNNSTKPSVSHTSASKSTQNSLKTIGSPDQKVSVTIPSTWMVLPDKPGSTIGTEITETTKSGDLMYQCNTPGVYTIPSLAQTCNYAVGFELPSKTEDFFNLSIWYNDLTLEQTIQSEVLSTNAPAPVIVSQNRATTTNGYSEQYVKSYTKNSWNQNTYITYLIADKGYLTVFSWNESDQPWNISGQDPYQTFDYSNLAPEVTNVVNSLKLNF